MNLIVAVDNNWAIGNKGDLLVKIPDDQKFFREVTTGNVVVLGRKTLSGFPNGIPLKNRINIILSEDVNFKVKDATVVHSIAELFKELEQYKSENIYIIGGGMVYESLYEYCDTAHVTKIDYNYQGDTYFPNLDKLDNWKITQDSEEQTYFNLEYYFYKYENASPKKWNNN